MTDIDLDELDTAPAWPNPDWTPRQQENYTTHVEGWYTRLETELGDIFARRTWRPKKRNDGYKERDDVTIGTPEDYVATHVDDVFEPMTSFYGVMMREVSSYDVPKEVLDEAVSDIVSAQLGQLADDNPQDALQLLKQTEYEAQLYGVEI